MPLTHNDIQDLVQGTINTLPPVQFTQLSQKYRDYHIYPTMFKGTGADMDVKTQSGTEIEFQLLIKNSAMTDGEVKAQMLADFPEYEAYHAAQPEPEPEPDGIVAVESTTKSATDVYTLSGQKVSAAYKGLVIKNGVKAIQK